MTAALDTLADCLDLIAPAHEEGIVYILRFERAIGNPAKKHGTAQFYIGWCKAGGLERRLKQHRTGLGAKLTAAAAEQGIALVPINSSVLLRRIRICLQL